MTITGCWKVSLPRTVSTLIIVFVHARADAGISLTKDASFFHDEARRLGNPLRAGIRGSPLNYGPELEAVHPVIRTNPVTGWKGIFVNKGFTKRINGVTRDESDVLLSYIYSVSTRRLYLHGGLGLSADLTFAHSSSPKTTICKCDSAGRKTRWPSGTTVACGIARPTTTMRLVLETVCARWESALSLTPRANRGSRSCLATERIYT